MRIGLNAGHTLSGPGYGTEGAIKESTETRRVCERLTQLFRAANVEVVPCTVDKAPTQKAYLNKVTEMANSTSLDWFISIHFNNDAKRAGQGVEVHTYKGRQYEDAVEVCKYIAALGFKNRGVKDGSKLHVVGKTRAKAMLIEVCFVNNPDAEEYQKKFEQICEAIVCALADYVQANPKPVAPVQPEKKNYVRVRVDGLAVRRTPSWEDSAVCRRVNVREVFTIADGPIAVGGGKMYRLLSGVYITAAEKYVETYYK